MKTIIEVIDQSKDNTEILNKAGQVIKAGGLVAFPTETVYGLGGDGLNPDAAKKIYAAKGRPSDNPLIIHISNMKQLEMVAEGIDERARKMAEKYWPGPLTMIFKKKDIVPLGTTGGLDTVAVRMPSNEVALKLIEASGTVIAAPSANISGRPSPTTGKRVVEDLEGRVEMILDAGSVDIGLESTIIDMTQEKPAILRPGAITKEMMEAVLGDVDVDLAVKDPKSVNEGYKPKAPGMKYRHYAPKAELKLFKGEDKIIADKINELSKKNISEGKKVGIICFEETKHLYNFGEVVSIGSKTNDREIAHNLYEVLRKFDDKEVDVIYSEIYELGTLGKAIMNRFSKAAGCNIEEV